MKPEERKAAESVTVTAAAAVTGKVRSTIVRALDAGRFPNAYRVGEGETAPWRIPLADLEAAGYAIRDAAELAEAATAGSSATLGGQLAIAARALELAGQRDAELAGWRDRLLDLEVRRDQATHDLARSELALEKLRGERELERERHARELEKVKASSSTRRPALATAVGLGAIGWAAVIAIGGDAIALELAAGVPAAVGVAAILSANFPPK